MSNMKLRFECARCGVYDTNAPHVVSGGKIACPDCGDTKVRKLGPVPRPPHPGPVAPPQASNSATALDAAGLARAVKLVQQTHFQPFTLASLQKSTYPPWGQLSGSHLDHRDEAEPLPRRTQTEPIIGYRRWALNGDEDPRLCSLTAEYVWEGPVCRNEHPPAEQSPDWADQDSPSDHGIYASATLVEILYSFSFISTAVAYVAGSVALSGTVIVHDRGYRAQCATIQGLLLPPGIAFQLNAAGRQRLADRYQCDVTTDPRDLLPKEKEEDHGDRPTP